MADVSIVYVDLSENVACEGKAYTYLDERERERAQRIREPESRRQFMLCRAALRNVLAERVDCSNAELHFTSLRNEKPQALVGGRSIDLEFNVSHTIGHGMLAFAKHGRLGIDIEHRNIRHDLDGELRKVFSKREQQALATSVGIHKAEIFLRLWTIKEALIKATGEGFRADTTAFSVPESYIRGEQCARFQFPDDMSIEWQLVNLGSGSYAAALAREVL